MRRKYANQLEGDYYQKKIETEFFNGIVGYVKLKDINKPVIISNDLETICIKDNDYEWLEFYPDNGKYTICAVFDNNSNIVEWYFDVSKNVGIEDGIPYQDDLYLDLVISPNGEYLVLDEDELLKAEKEGDITHKDVEDAYKILEYLKDKYVNNFDIFNELSYELLDMFHGNIFN